MHCCLWKGSKGPLCCLQDREVLGETLYIQQYCTLSFDRMNRQARRSRPTPAATAAWSAYDHRALPRARERSRVHRTLHASCGARKHAKCYRVGDVKRPRRTDVPGRPPPLRGVAAIPRPTREVIQPVNPAGNVFGMLAPTALAAGRYPAGTAPDHGTCCFPRYARGTFRARCCVVGNLQRPRCACIPTHVGAATRFPSSSRGASRSGLAPYA